MRIKQIYIGMIAFSLSIGLSSCGNTKTLNTTAEHSSIETIDVAATTIPEKSEKEIVLEVGASGDFACSYDTLEVLEENAENIIKGTVLKTKVQCDDTGTVFTEYSICINDNMKGNQENGNIIKVNCIGGVINAKEYLKKQQDPKMDSLKEKVENSSNDLYVKYTFDNAWLPEEGKEYVWFLEENKDANTYTSLNVYQGVYKCENNEMERFEPEINKTNIGKLEYKNVQKDLKNKK